jgi:hypothetical protein
MDGLPSSCMCFHLRRLTGSTYPLAERDRRGWTVFVVRDGPARQPGGPHRTPTDPGEVAQPTPAGGERGGSGGGLELFGADAEG